MPRAPRSRAPRSAPPVRRNRQRRELAVADSRRARSTSARARSRLPVGRPLPHGPRRCRRVISRPLNKTQGPRVGRGRHLGRRLPRPPRAPRAAPTRAINSRAAPSALEELRRRRRLRRPLERRRARGRLRQPRRSDATDPPAAASQPGMVARAIHRAWRRAKGPCVNCAAPREAASCSATRNHGTS